MGCLFGLCGGSSGVVERKKSRRRILYSSKPNEPKNLNSSVSDAYNEALKHAETDLVNGYLESAKTHAIPVKLSSISDKQPDSKLPFETNGDDRTQGYMGIALQWAFYELLHAENFASGLENVIARGGDTDTNGCIAAALLGAYFGVDGINEEWIKSVRDAEPFRGCWNKERTQISIDFLGIKDADTLVEQLSNINIEQFSY